MVNVVAVILTSRADAGLRREFERRVVQRAAHRGMHAAPILFDPSPGDVRDALATHGVRHLVIAWGRNGLPDWGAAFRAYVPDLDLDALHVFEIGDAVADPLRPRQEQSHEGAVHAVAQGFYVSSVVPYGMTRLRAEAEVRRPGRTRVKARSLLRPGDPGEIEVVRWIYEMFVHEGRSRREIQNTLNAERVPAPNHRRAWQPDDLDLILTDPVYIGASRLGRTVAYGIRPPVIAPELYFLAQAKLHERCGDAATAPGRWARPNPVPAKATKRSASTAPRRATSDHHASPVRGTCP